MKFRIFSLTIILLLHVCLLSAQSLPNTLLWRITGRNGQRPSYLFGTLHLADERIFTLGDSLFEAIRSTDGFATELDPNQLTMLVVDEINKQIVDSKNIREMLSDKEYRKYAPVLAKKLGKSPDKINTADILKQKNKWISDSYKEGKMQTFLDMYLFDIARRQNKWTGGIEDVSDQRGAIDNIIDQRDIAELAKDDHNESISVLESLTNMYIRQDLHGIDSMINGYSGYMDSIMLKRNKKMAVRMDSLSSVRSMVFAVGAAHLPGSQGLIALLRQRGFEVQPVFYSQRIRAADYHVREMPLIWNDFTDDHGWYQASMPGKPSDVEAYGLIDMKMYLDLFNSSCYFTMAARSVYAPEKTDSIMNAMALKVFPSGDGKNYVPFNPSGTKGRMYTSDKVDGYRKGFILSRNGILYVAAGILNKKDTQNISNINRFLKAFKVLDAPLDDTGKVYKFTDSVSSFSIETPSPAKIFELPENLRKTADWRSLLYLSADPNGNGYYFFGINSIQPGHYIVNDSIFMAATSKKAAEKLVAISSDTTYLWNGYRVLEFSGDMKEAPMVMHTRYISRGNRWYGLVAMYPRTIINPGYEKFFNSFALLDYPSHPWQASSPADSLFSTWSPSRIDTLARDSSESSTIDIQYIGYDSSNCNSFGVIGYHLNPYYWSKSDSSFWASIIATQISYNDSLVYKQPVTNGEARGWEWAVLARHSNMFHRERILLNGDRLYYLYLCAPEKDAQSANANRFFDDFRFLGQLGKTTYFDSKAARLLTEIMGTDSATVVTANDALAIAPFSSNDLPFLHQALLEKPHIASNDKLDAGDITNNIANAITDLKDSSSFRFAAFHYRTLPDSMGYLKNHFLEIMSVFQDSLHYAEMAGLLLASPPREPVKYRFQSSLDDSLQLTAQIMPGLLPLLSDTTMREVVLYLAADLADSNLLSVSKLAPYQQGLISFAARRAAKLSQSDDATKPGDVSLMRLLGRMNNPLCNAALKRFLSSRSHYMCLRAAELLIRNKQMPDPAILLALATDKSTRLDLYRALQKAGKTSLFLRHSAHNDLLVRAKLRRCFRRKMKRVPLLPIFLQDRLIPIPAKRGYCSTRSE
jgi:uncharacterized protein YbaP (TraB family)